MNRHATHFRMYALWAIAWTLSVGFVLILPRFAPAQTAAPAGVEVSMPATQPSPAVAELVRQLGDESFAIRDAAQEKLAAMDPSIEGELRGAIAGGLSPEANSRAQALANALRDQRYLGGTRITIHAKDAPLADVLKSFTAQAQAPMGTDAPTFADDIATRRITLDLDHADFWQAIRQLADAGQMGLALDGQEKVQFTADRATAQPIAPALAPAFTALAATFGPLRISPLCGEPSSVALRIFAEPKIRPIPSACTCMLESCIDDLGESHVQVAPLTHVPPNSLSLSQYLFTNKSADAATKLALFKAEYRLAVDVNHQTFDFDDLAKAAGQTHLFASGSIEISPLTGDGTTRKLTVNLAMNNGFGTGITLGGARITFGNPPCSIALLDDRGAVITAAQFSIKSTMPIYSVAFAVPVAARLTKVRCDAPGEVRTLVVPIEFHDIPLKPNP